MNTPRGLATGPPSPTRRAFLRRSALLAAALVSGGLWRGCASSRPPSDYGLASEPDANGLLLPPATVSRVVARSGQAPVSGGGYLWPGAPDGGATFATGDGGWIYVCNSELSNGAGGVGALRFAADGAIVDAYPILQGTHRNCAGGATPWGTWLSCEEVQTGRVWECDPLGQAPAVVRPALGVFSHEAAAVDAARQVVYLTEDMPDGRLYRFTPATWPDLSAGTLEVARVAGTVVAGTLAPGASAALDWLPVPDPSAASTPTRQQVPTSTAFAGGEGIAVHGGAAIFSTKGDDRIWRYDAASDLLSIVYDAATAPDPVLTGVDNLIVDPDGAILVAEDGGDMQVVILLPFGGPRLMVQVVGHPGSEVTGLAFDPAGRRLYFSSQRGSTGLSSGGTTYELTSTAS